MQAIGMPELIVDIDVNDDVWLRDRAMTAQDVRDLVKQLREQGTQTLIVRCGCLGLLPYRTDLSYPMGFDGDRKSTRLNSSHTVISSAVFCLQKKTKINRFHAP